MNNKGQSLVLFVCLLPLLIMVFAYIFDSSLIVEENIKLKSVARDAANYYLSGKTRSDVEEFISKSNEKIEILELTLDPDMISIDLKTTIDSVFGRIVGYKAYEVNASYMGYIENGKIIIREKG